MKSSVAKSSNNDEDQGETLKPGQTRKDIVLQFSKAQAQEAADKRALTAKTTDGSVSFLTLKKSINQVIDTRLKKIEGPRGVMKSIKKIQTKVDAKEVDTDDLPTSSVEILKNAKQVMKELKEAKKKMPKLKKLEIPAQQQLLSSMTDAYKDWCL